jgi:hypothetical protein
MDNLKLLEQQRNETDAKNLIKLSQDILQPIGIGYSVLVPASKDLKTIAIQLMSGEKSRQMLAWDIRAVVIEVGTVLHAPNLEWPWYLDNDPNSPNYNFAQALDQKFKDTIKEIVHVEREFSTQHRNVSRLYRTGSIGHGILQVLANAPARYRELEAYFPSINGASTITHMRRQGVIQKSDESYAQSPFVITELGEEILKQRGEFDFAMWKKIIKQRGEFALKVKQLPWTDPVVREKYLKKSFGMKSFSC